MSSQYSLETYGAMLADPVRMGAYRRALAAAVKPGDVVVDIGTGPGVSALLACQLGASHVYAIEPNHAVDLGAKIAHANGYSDRVTFIKGLSTEFTAPAPVDVLMSDLRGRFPLHNRHIPTIVDARTRLLKPGGVQIPRRDRLFVGAACDDTVHSRLRTPWLQNDFGLNLEAGYPRAVDGASCASGPSTMSLGNGQCWAEIDYTSVTSPHASGKVSLALPAGTRLNALELWFDAELIDGIGYATSPRDPAQVYGRILLPLKQDVVVAAGELVWLRMDMRLVDDRYMTSWIVRVVQERDGVERLRLDHSSLNAAPPSMREAQRRSPLYKPTSTVRTQHAMAVLQGIDAGLTVGAISSSLMSRWPAHFESVAQADVFVSEIVVGFAD